MKPFILLTSGVANLPDDDVDTDIIFPARFLLITEKVGLGRYAFFEKRFSDGIERADFPLHRRADGAPGILVAGANFGCGSSREQAVWALSDLGVRCIIAPSFGEIFRSNCFKNGVLPVVLPESVVAALRSERLLTVDLTSREIHCGDGTVIPFAIADGARLALLNGWDDVLTILNTQGQAIDSFEDRRRTAAPWLFSGLFPNP
jgi:3-isopropylmalate dehydratase small subunit